MAERYSAAIDAALVRTVRPLSEILELDVATKRERDLLPAEDVEHRDLVARSDGAAELGLDLFAFVVEVGDHNQQPAALQKIGSAAKGHARCRGT